MLAKRGEEQYVDFFQIYSKNCTITLLTLCLCPHPNMTRTNSKFFTSLCITFKNIHEYSVAEHLE